MTKQIRELSIDELDQVSGGNLIHTILEAARNAAAAGPLRIGDKTLTEILFPKPGPGSIHMR